MEGWGQAIEDGAFFKPFTTMGNQSLSQLENSGIQYKIHAPQKYPIQEMRELECLCTNSCQSLANRFSQRTLIPCYFGLLCPSIKQNLVARDSPQEKACRCWHLEFGLCALTWSGLVGHEQSITTSTTDNALHHSDPHEPHVRFTLSCDQFLKP